MELNDKFNWFFKSYMLCFNVVTVIVHNYKLDVNGNLLVWKCKETMNESINFVVVVQR